MGSCDDERRRTRLWVLDDKMVCGLQRGQRFAESVARLRVCGAAIGGGASAEEHRSLRGTERRGWLTRTRTSQREVCAAVRVCPGPRAEVHHEGAQAARPVVPVVVGVEQAAGASAARTRRRAHGAHLRGCCARHHLVGQPARRSANHQPCVGRWMAPARPCAWAHPIRLVVCAAGPGADARHRAHPRSYVLEPGVGRERRIIERGLPACIEAAGRVGPPAWTGRCRTAAVMRLTATAYLYSARSCACRAGAAVKSGSDVAAAMIFSHSFGVRKPSQATCNGRSVSCGLASLEGNTEARHACSNA